MGLASEVAGAISDGINHLCILLEWNDAGAIGSPPVDGVTLKETMTAVGWAMRELMYGGRIHGGEPPTEEELARMNQLEALITGWPSAGALSPEVVTLAEACVCTLCGGKSWRELMAAARGKPAPASGEPPRMSIDEWAAMPEDEPGELVAGRLVEEEMADYEHETVVSFANAALRGWVVPRGGFVAGSEAKFAVGREQGRKPDLSVYLPGGSVPPRRGPIRVPPDIMIEVVLPTAPNMRRDRIEKPHDYAAFGVRWYWLIVPNVRVLEVFELGDDGRYVRRLAAAEGSVAIPGCADFTLDLDALWAELARLGPTGATGY